MTADRPADEPPVYRLGPTPPAEPDTGYRRGLLHGLLIGGVAAVVLAVLLGVSLFRGGSGDRSDGSVLPTGEKFTVGGCARQDERDAVAVDCADARTGDFRITDEVSSPGDCPDQEQPVIKLEDVVYCLVPFRD